MDFTTFRSRRGEEAELWCSRQRQEADLRVSPFRSLFSLAFLLVLSARLISGATLTQDLERAIVDGNQPRFDSLLAQADSDPKPVITTRLLNGAAYFGREKMLDALLAKKLDLKALDGDGWNTLHAAALGGHPKVVAHLLDLGFDVNSRIRSDGMTPLGVAAVRGNTDVVRLLLAHHADLSLPDFGGNTPLIHAALRGRTETVRLLLDSGADVNLASKAGWTPLMAASWEGHADLVELLLKHGAKIQATNAQGESARSLAESAEHGEIAKLLATSKP